MFSARLSRPALLMLSIIIAAALAGCPSKDNSTGNGAASSSRDSGTAKAPSGVYESRMPDNTVFRLNFLAGGKAKMTMTENGVEETKDMNWVINGESIMVQSPDAGMPIQLYWKGDALTSNLWGTVLTFTKK